MTDFQLSTPVTSPTAIRPVDRYELGDAIRNAWLKHGQDSWLTIADEVFAALAQPSPEGDLTTDFRAARRLEAALERVAMELDSWHRYCDQGVVYLDLRPQLKRISGIAKDALEDYSTLTNQQHQ